MEQLKAITPRAKKFDQWFTDIVLQARLARYGAVKGTLIFEPNGWKIWEQVQQWFNKRFSELCVQNVAMPLFIPLSLIEKEKAHVEGFAPELYMVTKKGAENLAEPLVLRPTSEVTFATYFAEVIQTYRDLPLLLNQWANVIRAEKNTRPFLRNSEFHWQEGHTCHASAEEALAFSLKIQDLQAEFCTEVMGIPVIKGEKTPGERFAGAERSFTIESLMQDGQALQTGTSHYFGQKFASAYGIKFQNKANKQEFAYQTSWGVSTRLIGALIMSHSDDRGLVLPPAIAPTQVAILPLLSADETKAKPVLEAAHKLNLVLSASYRCRIDLSDKSLGFKSAEQEVIGTPVRIEIGPRDLAENKVTIARRDTGTKTTILIGEVAEEVRKTLDEIKDNIFAKAQQRLENSVHFVKDIKEFKDNLAQGGFIAAYWSGSIEDEKKLKEMTGATPRCIVSDIKGAELLPKKCFLTGQDSAQLVYFARAY